MLPPTRPTALSEETLDDRMAVDGEDHFWETSQTDVVMADVYEN
jgi:hypothetical protein